MPADLEAPAQADAVADTTGTTLTESSQDHSPDANTAQSSSADEPVAKKPESLLDAVKAVVQQSSEDASTASEKAETDTDPNDPTSADNPAKTDDGTKEDLESEKDVPFHKHPRWKQVIAERDSLKALEPKAREFDLITQFMQTNGLSVEEAARGYEAMAAIKNNPAKALEILTPIMESLRVFTGERLSDDLQQQLEDGMISREHANELARRRAQDVFHAERQREAQAYQAQVQEAQNRQAMASTVTAWENDIRTRDADFARKQSLVMDRARALMASAPPTTPEAALKLVKDAYKSVNDDLKGFIPAPRAVTTQTSTGTSGSSAKPQPKTLMEACLQAVGR